LSERVEIGNKGLESNDPLTTRQGAALEEAILDRKTWCEEAIDANAGSAALKKHPTPLYHAHCLEAHSIHNFE
jgi:hypothetical protein